MRKSLSGNSVSFDLKSLLHAACERSAGFTITNNSRGNSQVSQKEIQEISSPFTGCKENGQRSTLFILELKPMPSADGSSGNLDYKRAGRELEVYLCI